MAETPQDVVNRELREFKRYTGDGLPGEPVNAPLPVGDPQSGVHNPKKVNLRKAMLAPVEAAAQSASDAKDEADRAEEEADRSDAAADRAENSASSFIEVATNFKTVTALLADETMGYSGSGKDVIVGEGDIVTAKGFRYEVAASDAVDWHVETAGGVKLYVLPTATGWAGEAFGMLPRNVAPLHDNYAAGQKCLDVVVASGGGIALFPEGTIYTSDALRVRDAGTSYYSLNPTVAIFGQGAGTVITRDHDQATDVVDPNDQEECLDGAGIAWFASNSMMSQIAFENCKVGLFMGQNPDQALNSGASTTNITMNRFSKLWFKDCAIGHIGFAPMNLYYNSFEDIHVSQCQYAWIMAWDEDSPYYGGVANYNRNHFRNVRFSRSWIGLLNLSGGTNVFHAFHCEGNSGTPPTSNRYDAPTINVPVDRQGQATAVICGPSSLGNIFQGCVFEANDWEIHNEGVHNSFDGDFNAVRCYWGVPPTFFSIPEAHMWALVGSDGAASHLWAAPSNATATYGNVTVPAAMFYEKAPRGRELHTEEQGDKIFMGNAKIHKRVISLGSFTSGQAKTITLQSGVSADEYMSDSSGIITCRLVGHCSASALTVVKTFSIAYYRASNRGISRSYIFDEVDARATGVGTGDSSDSWSVAVQNGSDSRIMELVVTAASLVFDRVVLYVEEMQTKDKDL